MNSNNSCMSVPKDNPTSEKNKQSTKLTSIFHMTEFYNPSQANPTQNLYLHKVFLLLHFLSQT